MRRLLGRFVRPFVALLAAFVTIVATWSVGARAQTAAEVSLENLPDVRPLEGRTISRVDVELTESEWKDVTAPTLARARIGDRFTVTVARRALDEALATQKFARGRVLVVPDGDSVRLVVRLEPRKMIEQVRVDIHAETFDRDNLLREADLAAGGELSGRDIHEKREKILAELAREGWPKAAVEITTRPTDDPNRVVVLVDVVPGPARKIERRVFYVFGADPDRMKAQTATYGTALGERADETALASSDAKLATDLRALGWYRVDVSHDVVSHGGQNVLRVRIDAGPKFLVRFEGNVHYDARTLEAALELESDADRGASRFVDKIRDFYQKRGFLDVDVRLELQGRDTDRERAYVFRIVESPRVSVSQRSYPCLGLSDIKELREGGPTSPEAIGREIDSYLEEELPGEELIRAPDPTSLAGTITTPSESSPTRLAEPVELRPGTTFFPDTYERALEHVRDLYRNEGFLSAEVGPFQVLRKRCSPKSRPGECRAEPLPPLLGNVCAYDAQNIPMPEAPLDPALHCVPDPSKHVTCAPEVALRIPIKLGPRTQIYDLAFFGAMSIAETKLAEAAKLALGDYASNAKLEEATRNVLELYKEEGFAYADIKYTLDPSLDHTRARVRFDVREGDRVLVRDILVRGNDRTAIGAIRSRFALEVGKPYRTSDVRKTQERISTLGVFSSVTVGLDDPYVPERRKLVVITVVENKPRYLEPRIGFSTGEGIRLSLEFADRNLFRYAVSSSTRVQLAYLPTAFILDPGFRANVTGVDPVTGLPNPNSKFSDPGFDQRLVVRATQNVTIPEVGLGPLVRMSIDAVGIRDLQRDFAIRKFAGSGSLIYQPVRELQFSLGPSVERNEIVLFREANINAFLQKVGTAPDLQRALRVPDGDSVAVAQRFTVAWDRRDNPFNPHRGTYFVAGVEHVDSFPLPGPANNVDTFEGHFLRLTQTFSGYIPITKRITLAAQLRLGEIAHVVSTARSRTYPDRLFFLGGPESLRGFLQDTLIPQDLADRIETLDCPTDPNDKRFALCNVGLRGGNLMINPRLELRVPIVSPLEIGLFLDSGNVWVDPAYVLEWKGTFSLRTAAGAGVRIQTPVGPIALDYGFNLARRAWEDVGALNFSIGVF
ncbi:MAG: POTRA domain-containing protein [Polyangiaceae bacterium]